MKSNKKKEIKEIKTRIYSFKATFVMRTETGSKGIVVVETFAHLVAHFGARINVESHVVIADVWTDTMQLPG